MYIFAKKSCNNGAWAYINIALNKGSRLNRICFDISEFPVGQELYLHVVYGTYTTFAYNLPILFKKIVEFDSAVGRAEIQLHENLNGIEILDGALTIFIMQWVNLGAAKTVSVTIDYEAAING